MSVQKKIEQHCLKILKIKQETDILVRYTYTILHVRIRMSPVSQIRFAVLYVMKIGYKPKIPFWLIILNTKEKSRKLIIFVILQYCVPESI